MKLNMIDKKILFFVLLIRFSAIIADEVRISNSGMIMESKTSIIHRFRNKRQVITVNLTPAEQQAVLEKHNALRRLEPASNMEKLRWNTELADMAQDWGDLCQGLTHGHPARDNPPYDYIGQNIWWSSGSTRPTDMTSAVQSWHDEIHFFHYDSNSCDNGKICGHYTQVIWAATTNIGCGYSNCGAGGQLIICNYGPGGNINGVIPYQLGYPCSKCSSGIHWCHDNLCNSQCTGSGVTCECAALCQNCGTKDDATCSCQCADGWFGTDCTTVCADNNAKCNNGWYVSWCTVDRPYVYNQCLKMCSRCVYVADPQTCPEVIPNTCTQWSEWDSSKCRPCGGCNSKSRTRECGNLGMGVEVVSCDPKYCIRGVHNTLEWLWITSKWTLKRKYIRRKRKCCYDFRAFWGTPHHLSREKYCAARRVQGWKNKI